jgi:hypothetical protein
VECSNKIVNNRIQLHTNEGKASGCGKGVFGVMATTKSLLFIAQHDKQQLRD